SGPNARPPTGEGWASGPADTLPEAASHSQTLAPLAAAKRPPSGANASAPTHAGAVSGPPSNSPVVVFRKTGTSDSVTPRSAPERRQRFQQVIRAQASYGTTATSPALFFLGLT